MQCYLQAQKNDSKNFNVVRDLSYFQLYLKHYHSFQESAKKALEIKPNLLVNWTTYAIANYFVKIVFYFRLANMLGLIEY